MATTSWLIGISGNWSIGGNWAGGLPNGTDDVTIASPGLGYTVTLNQNAFAHSLTIDSIPATLSETANGTLNITNGFNLEQGEAILDGANQIAGGITDSSLLKVAGASSLGGGSTLTMNNGELLALNSMTLANTLDISNGGFLAATQGSTMMLNPGSGGINIEAGNITIGDNSGNSGTVEWFTPPASSVQTDNYEFTVLSGTLKSGDQYFGSQILPDANGLDITQNATFDMNGYNTTVNDLTGYGIVESTRSLDQPPKLILNAAPDGDAGASSEFDGQIVGRVQVVIASGNVTFGGDNTYTGGTMIVSPATLLLGGANGSIAGPVVDNGQIDSIVWGSTTLAGTISGTGVVSSSGYGTTLITGSNTYSGGTIIDGGTVEITKAAAIGTGEIIDSGGDFVALNSMSIGNALDLGGTNFEGFSEISAATGGTVHFDSTTGWDIQSEYLTFGDGTNDGTIEWDTAAGSQNTQPYSVEVLDATLKAGAESLTQLLQNDSATLLSSGTIDIAGYSTTINSLEGIGSIINSKSAMSTLEIMGGDYLGTIAGRIAVNVEGNLILDGVNNYSGGTDVLSGAVLALGDGTNNGSITGNVVDQGVLVFDNSNSNDFTGKISGNGSVFQDGSGTLILDHGNTFTGGVTVGNDIAEIYQGSGLGTGQLTMQGGELLGAEAPGGTSTIVDVSNALELSGVVDFSAASGDTLKMKGVWLANTNTGESNAVDFGDTTDNGTVIWYTPAGSNNVDSDYAVNVLNGTLKAGDGNFGELLALDTNTQVGTGATLDFASFSTSVDGLTGNGAVSDSGGAAITITLFGADFLGTIDGNMTIDANGTVDLGGSDKFTDADIESSASLILGGTQKENVSFHAGATSAELVLDAGVKLGGAVSGFGIGDTIDVTFVGGPSTNLTFNSTTDVLTLSNGTVSQTIQMAGSYVAGNFNIQSDGSSGTDITFDANPAVVSKSDSFNFSGPAPAPAPVQNIVEHDTQATEVPMSHAAAPPEFMDLIESMLLSHHSAAVSDFAFI